MKQASLESLLEQHLSVVGITGSGKTHFARHLHKNTVRKSIFLNPQDEAGVAGVTMYDEWDPRILAEHDKINLVISEDEYYPAILEEVRADLFRIGRQIQLGRGRYNRWVCLWADEAQDVAPEGVRTSPLHKAIKRGRRHGITVGVITQAPADLAKGVLKQCQTHVIFRLGQYEGEYAKTYKLPITPGQLKGHQFVIANQEEVHGPYVL